MLFHSSKMEGKDKGGGSQSKGVMNEKSRTKEPNESRTRESRTGKPNGESRTGSGFGVCGGPRRQGAGAPNKAERTTRAERGRASRTGSGFGVWGERAPFLFQSFASLRPCKGTRTGNANGTRTRNANGVGLWGLGLAAFPPFFLLAARTNANAPVRRCANDRAARGAPAKLTRRLLPPCAPHVAPVRWRATPPAAACPDRSRGEAALL